MLFYQVNHLCNPDSNSTNSCGTLQQSEVQCSYSVHQGEYDREKFARRIVPYCCRNPAPNPLLHHLSYVLNLGFRADASSTGTAASSCCTCSTNGSYRIYGFCFRLGSGRRPIDGRQSRWSVVCRPSTKRGCGCSARPQQGRQGRLSRSRVQRP